MASGREFMIVLMRLGNALYTREITPVQQAEIIAYLYGGKPLRLPQAKNFLREMREIENFPAYIEALVQKYVG